MCSSDLRSRECPGISLPVPGLPCIITFVITTGSPMYTLKLTQIGNSVGVVLPKEALAQLKLEKGDTVFLTDAPGGFTLTPYDPAIEAQLELGREFMHDYRDTLRALAK